ncbi:MAG: Ribosomal L32p protein family, partial [Chloroflexota bacterium]
MTPLPKRRHSTGRRDRRRAHDALTAPHLIV